MRKNMTSLWRWSLSAVTLATLQMKYKVIMIVQMQMFYRLQAVKKKRLKRQAFMFANFSAARKKIKNCIVVSTTRFICLVKYENEVRHVDDLTSMKYSPVAMVALAPTKKNGT